MFLLSLIPSTSSMLVATRSVAYGFFSGICTALGVILGDLVLLLIAILGIIELTENLSEFFALIRYCAAAYLIWLGISLLRTEPIFVDIEKPQRLKFSSENITSFICGLSITMGDFKAIFFYLSLLPMFVELGSLTTTDVHQICLVTFLSVGAGKVGYVVLGSKTKHLVKRWKIQNHIAMLSGALLLSIGAILIMDV